MLTFSIIRNLLKIYTSFIISGLFKISFVWGYPSVLGIELTNNCNLRCPQCPSGAGILTRPSGFMSEKLLEKIVKENDVKCYEGDYFSVISFKTRIDESILSKTLKTQADKFYLNQYYKACKQSKISNRKYIHEQSLGFSEKESPGELIQPCDSYNGKDQNLFDVPIPQHFPRFH